MKRKQRTLNYRKTEKVKWKDEMMKPEHVENCDKAFT